MTSPFEPALAGRELDPVLRDQFLLPHGGGVVLEGEMDEVWHRPRAIRPLLALTSRWNVLFAETGSGVPARLEITRGAGGCHVWRRTFRFGVERRFDAELVRDGPRLVERTGPFELEWAVRLLEPGLLEVTTCGASLRVRGRRLRVPRALVPRVTAVERSRGRDRIHVAVTVRHPVLGAVFGYSGSFRLRRV